MPKTTYQCTYCGKLFERYATQVRHPERVTCSHSCSNKLNNDGRGNPNFRQGHYCLESRCRCGNLKDWRSKKCAICSGRGFPKDASYGVPDNTIVRAIRESTHFREAAEKAGIGRSTITRRAKQMGLDISHFDAGRGRRLSADRVLTISKRRRSGKMLIRALFEGAYVDQYVCGECGQAPVWNGKFLQLQVHHINGHSRDNRPENLRILCPNCHTQTETYKGRNYGNADSGE